MSKPEPSIERAVENFLYHEAELLDRGQFEQWLELLTKDVVYEMPVRVTRERGQSQDSTSRVGHFRDDRETIELRIKRLRTEYAWAEDPPTRTRRFVSNVRVRPVSGTDEVEAESYLLLLSSRGSSWDLVPVSAERRDLLRRVYGQWKLAKRHIQVDQASLGIKSLSIFL